MQSINTAEKLNTKEREAPLASKDNAGLGASGYSVN